jgi:hypothetical protein
MSRNNKIHVTVGCDCNQEKHRATFHTHEELLTNVCPHANPALYIKLTYHNCLENTINNDGLKHLLLGWTTATIDFETMVIKEDGQLKEKVKSYGKTHNYTRSTWEDVDGQETPQQKTNLSLLRGVMGTFSP